MTRRLGYVLIEQQLISRQELRQALQLQVRESVYRLFRWQEGSYHFSPEPVTYDREVYEPVPAELILMEGVRMIDEWSILEKTARPGSTRRPPGSRVAFPRSACSPPVTTASARAGAGPAASPSG